MEMVAKKHPHYWKLFIDGASRKNPGKSGAGIYITKDGKKIFAQGYYLGIKTNNQAEYLALLLGILHVKELIGPQDLLLIVSDSQLLVRQLQGIYALRNPYIREVNQYARQLLIDISYDVQHVLRDQNTYADEQANKGIDTEHPIPSSFTMLLEQHGISL